MRILHISTRLILGGSQENTVLSCEGQARLGHKVHLAYGPIYGPEGSMLDRIKAFNARCESGQERVRAVGRHVPARPEGEVVVPIVLHEVPHLVREVRPVADWLCTRELWHLIERVGPDVVHTHSSKAGILGRRAAWKFQSPRGNSPLRHKAPGVVHTIHGPPFMPLEGGAVARAITQAKNFAYALAERSAARRCHLIASVAEAMTEQFLARGIGRPQQYITVYSGMEVDAFLDAAPGEDRRSSRSALGFEQDDIVIGTVARLAEHKGHDDILDALAEDLKSNPNWRLLWVGDGWWRARLTERARQLGVAVRELDRLSRHASAEAASSVRPNAQLVLTGLVPSERVPSLIRAMDILVHPSYREGLPRTVPQALLCGVPAVAYDVDGTREICVDGETGKLVEPGNTAQLKSAIRELAVDPALRAALGVTGRDRCSERFSAERMVAELEAVYGRAVAAARPGESQAAP
ncbi:MAG: glycosyltransferase family 4 protein [Phycisphaerales bacterium]|nr:glycosyltransferase family 4 protein [Phycisphaerales bacterium]